MLEYAVKRLGACGVAVGGHVNGESLSAPKFDAFWAKVQELGSSRSCIRTAPAIWCSRARLPAAAASATSSATRSRRRYFLSRLIFDGTFDKFPTLKVCGAHGGGYLPSYIGRTEVACQRNGQQCIIKRKPSDYMHTNILADAMVFRMKACAISSPKWDRARWSSAPTRRLAGP